MSKKSNGGGVFWLVFAFFALLPKVLAKGDELKERDIAAALILVFVLIPFGVCLWLKIAGVF